MTTKDFIVIANILRATRPATGRSEVPYWYAVVDEMKRDLKSVYPNFNPQKFTQWIEK